MNMDGYNPFFKYDDNDIRYEWMHMTIDNILFFFSFILFSMIMSWENPFISTNQIEKSN